MEACSQQRMARGSSGGLVQMSLLWFHWDSYRWLSIYIISYQAKAWDWLRGAYPKMTEKLQFIDCCVVVHACNPSTLGGQGWCITM